MRPLNWGEKEIDGRAQSAGDARCATLGPQGIEDTFKLVKHENLTEKIGKTLLRDGSS